MLTENVTSQTAINAVHVEFNTFFAWQYSFSITFPRTHGRLEVPDAAQKNTKNRANVKLIIYNNWETQDLQNHMFTETWRWLWILLFSPVTLTWFEVQCSEWLGVEEVEGGADCEQNVVVMPLVQDDQDQIAYLETEAEKDSGRGR